MGEHENWLKLCQADEVSVQRIEHHGGAYLYLTIRGDSKPIWQVWNGDIRIYAGTWMQEAYRLYRACSGLLYVDMLGDCV